MFLHIHCFHFQQILFHETYYYYGLRSIDHFKIRCYFLLISEDNETKNTFYPKALGELALQAQGECTGKKLFILE